MGVGWETRVEDAETATGIRGASACSRKPFHRNGWHGPCHPKTRPSSLPQAEAESMMAGKAMLSGALLACVAAGCGGQDTDAGMGGEAATESAAAQVASDPDVAPAGEAMGLPAGFEVRLDRPDGVLADFHTMSMDGGLHVETGPPGILYNAAESTIEAGNYSVSATFTEIGAPIDHREAYGLFIGGSDLQGPAQAYTYFLVRADGSYLIKKRTGEETVPVTEGRNGWVVSESVHAAAQAGDVANALEIRIDGETAHFSINGTEVTTLPVSAINAWGVAGARINHNLNVQVSNWTLTRG